MSPFHCSEAAILGICEYKKKSERRALMPITSHASRLKAPSAQEASEAASAQMRSSLDLSIQEERRKTNILPRRPCPVSKGRPSMDADECPVIVQESLSQKDDCADCSANAVILYSRVPFDIPMVLPPLPNLSCRRTPLRKSNGGVGDGGDDDVDEESRLAWAAVW